MAFEEIEVFGLKRLSLMMLALILNVSNNAGDVGMRDRKRTESFLPRKPATEPALFVNVVR